MKTNLALPFMVIGAVAIIAALFVFLMRLSHPPLPDSGLTFFYSQNCPRCAKVEKFFADNEIDKKISFKKVEVNSSTENAQLFFDASRACGVTKTEEMSVPLLWDGAACISGDEPIVSYFEERLNL
jgi:hypothetical protein